MSYCPQNPTLWPGQSLSSPLAQKSCEKIAEVPEIRHAPRTKVASTRPCAAHYYFTTSLRVDPVSLAFRSEKESVQRRDHANFAPNSREKIAESPENFGAPRTQKLRKLGQRGCAKRRTSLQLFSESACVLMQDKARVQRRDDANFAQNSREKFAKFPEIRDALRTKIVCTRPAWAVHTLQRR